MPETLSGKHKSPQNSNSVSVQQDLFEDPQFATSVRLSVKNKVAGIPLSSGVNGDYPSSISPRYTDVDSRKSDGATYTPDALARFVAGQILEHTRKWSRDRAIRALDPAVGEGSLAVALLDALRAEGFTNVSFMGLDTNTRAVETASSHLEIHRNGYRVQCETGNFLSTAVSAGKIDDIFSQQDEVNRSRYDIIIANPPYVRTQILGGHSSQALAKRFSLSGRVDLYHAFLLTMADALSPGGVAGIIVSNRFMTTKAGASIREILPRLMSLRSLWDLGDTKLFDAAVLPAVIVGTGKMLSGDSENEPAKFTSLYSTSGPAEARAPDPISALGLEGVVEVDDGRRFHVQQGFLETGGRVGDVWRLSTSDIRNWLAVVKKHTRFTFGELGKIRVGVKTTADRVFIRDDWSCDDGEPELLRPLITHHIARRYRSESPVKSILYPHKAENGRCVPVDLSAYPRTQSYLMDHRPKLEGRKYLRKAGRRWYEIWVPQDPLAWERQKLVFRDISERPVFWMDLGGAVVNGDCYWLAPASSTAPDWLWLALAVANSTFCEIFYDRRFNNKLYAGRRRFITQYVEHFPVPDPETELASKAIQIAKHLHESKLDEESNRSMEQELDLIVWQMFGVSPEEPGR